MFNAQHNRKTLTIVHEEHALKRWTEYDWPWVWVFLIFFFFIVQCTKSLSPHCLFTFATTINGLKSIFFFCVVFNSIFCPIFNLWQYCRLALSFVSFSQSRSQFLFVWNRKKKKMKTKIIIFLCDWMHG